MNCFLWHFAVVGACVTLVTSGSKVLQCNITVTWRDLRGLLQWDCPVHKPNTAYTVQKKTQGASQWEAVKGCERVMSRSCDVSRVFAKYNLYNWVRLGQEVTPGSVLWSEPKMSDPLEETDYSPPSLSLSLQGSNLTVSVTMVCSPLWACPPRDCCPLSKLVDLCISITVYSETRPLWRQTHQKCSKEEKVSYVFMGLAQGQRHCVVANFTSSPASSPAFSPASFPQCVGLPKKTVAEFQKLWLFGAVFFMLFIIVPAIYYLKQRWPSAKPHLPRALESLQNGESMELGLPHKDFQEELGGDHISILSRSPSGSCGVLTLLTPPEAQTDCPSQGDGYYSNPLLMDIGSGQAAWDSGGTGGDLEINDVTLLLQCVVAPSLSQDFWGLPPQTHTGPGGKVPGPPKLPSPDNVQGCGVAQDVPLCSVRLEACEEEKLEDAGWFDLKIPSPAGSQY